MAARLVELGFVRSTDARKPITVRLQVTDDDTGQVMTSVDLTEHEFAALLAGSVITTEEKV